MWLFSSSIDSVNFLRFSLNIQDMVEMRSVPQMETALFC